jgi:hypothetical protein
MGKHKTQNISVPSNSGIDHSLIQINMGDPRYSKLSDGTLMIENTLDSDAGVYECMAKSPVVLRCTTRKQKVNHTFQLLKVFTVPS